MATSMQKLVGVSEEDDEEEMEMDVKEEDDEDEENGEKQIAAQMMIGVDEVMPSTSSSDQFQYQPQLQEQVSNQGGGGGARRSRPLEEKERTKLRERHRRAITARILAGLRRHGNYNLRVRADINDVIAALAREAGWVVLPDGTTFPSRSQSSPAAGTSAGMTSSSSQMVSQQIPPPPATLQGVSSGYRTTVEYNACRMKGVFMPTPSPYDLSSTAPAQSSGVVADGGEQTERLPLIAGSLQVINDKQIIGLPTKLPERDFAGTPFVPVYVMLPLGVINMKCELADPDGLLKQLRVLKSINVDGVMVDCWWGIVEAHAPQEYNWNGYQRLFQMVRELKLKLQVVMSFHECGGNVGDDVCIPLPHWVAEIGRSNPEIFFTDREGRRNPECLSWGIDKERVLRGRTAVEVYFDYMRSFRVEFDEFFEDGIISMVEVGLGPCGELRYPSCPVKNGWRYPGIGEFQCHDQYMLKSLRKAAEMRGHSFWARGPDNAGSYNSQPHETGFFCDGGDYDGYYGRFFLNWYSQVLLNHGDRVLSLAKLAFDGTCITAKQLPGIHWWYKTASHAAELTAGYYNPCNRDGYTAIATMLQKHGAALSFSCTEHHILEQQDHLREALADPRGLVWQVLNAAWDVCIPIASENAFLCHDRVGYNKILDNVKPVNDPDGRHFSSFTYHRLSPLLMERQNFMEFERFVKRMHGEAVLDPQV
ncbi:beta-amylase 7 isoform X1 [Gossypium arboreum]|uniref:beta-amylase 7 isoform X1 n=1 Tax=Gossypium arboreum TaxID=29729 RepID=UPI0022F172AE|nr:beta-amylase 7 isoform X1 [Gossypium arboreum]XP_052874372.1 beta-amylase 7 isoform X1 [Gossypium arboreum]XP_052874373.1 beta-amylase 7 isoform X1 [Gossypium arboreum]XP_052874374.1 beta-amylase 7 isoform X1 [Gossypium arboreum]